MRISITILVVVVLAACGSNDAQNRTRGLALGFEPTPSEPGEEVALILRNGSALQISYDLCTARLSQQRGGGWVLVGSRRDCTTERQVLEPGAEDSDDFELPEELDGGSYRFSMRVEVGGTRIEEIYSPTFRIPESTLPDTADAEPENNAS
jgi:hypothetical protein